MNKPVVGDRILYVGFSKVDQAIVISVEEKYCIIRWYKNDRPLEGLLDQEEYLEDGNQQVFYNEFTEDIREFGFFNLDAGRDLYPTTVSVAGGYLV